MKDIKISVFLNVRATAPSERSIARTLDAIRDGAVRTQVEAIRAEPDKSKRDTLKKELPAVTWSGTFSERKAQSLIQHSGFTCLDFDALSDVATAKQSVIADERTYAVFISPSGNGLKILIRIDGARHRESFDTLTTYFEQRHGLVADQSGKDVSRLCFMSFDENLYVNPDAAQFVPPVVQVLPKPVEPRPVRQSGDLVERTLQKLVDARNGERHHCNTQVAYTLGGLAAGGQVDERAALAALETVITGKFEESRHAEELRTARQSFAEGQDKPIEKALHSANAPPERTRKAPEKIILISTDEIKFEKVDWIAENFFARGKLTEIFGDAGSGKSLIVQSMFQHQSRNSLGISMPDNLRCLYVVGADMSRNEVRRRRDGVGGAFRMLHNESEVTVDFANDESVSDFIDGLRGSGLDAVVLDVKRDFFTGDENSSATAAVVMANFRRLADELNVSVILLSHGCKNHAKITINSVQGHTLFAGKLDVCWFVQTGTNGVTMLTCVKNRFGERGKAIKCKCVEASGVGFCLTDEAYQFDGTESNTAIAAGGVGRPSKVSLEKAREVLSDLPAEFRVKDFIRAAEITNSERTAWRLWDELKAENEVAPTVKGLWIKTPKSPDDEPEKVTAKIKTPLPNPALSNNFGSGGSNSQNGVSDSKTQESHCQNLLPKITAKIKDKGYAESFGSDFLEPETPAPLGDLAPVFCEPSEVLGVPPERAKNTFTDAAEFIRERLEIHPNCGVSLRVIEESFAGDIGDLKRELARHGVEYHARLDLFQGVRWQLAF